jgi:hypothetical protein
MSYQIVKENSRDGEAILKYIDSDKSINLNSVYSPLREVQRYLKQTTIQKKFYILIGAGNGTLVSELIKYSSKFIFLYIIEPFSEIELSNSIKDDLKHCKNVRYVNKLNFNQLEFVSILQTMIGVEVEIIIHPNYDRTNTRIVKELIENLNQAVKLTRMNKNTQQFFKKDWVLEPLLNLEYSMGLSHINLIKNRFAGETAIIAASGPSLKKDIDFIKRNLNNAYIFAAGSSFNGLISAEVTPDFVTCIDSSIRNYDVHFKNTTYRGPLITAGTVNSKILENHKGSVFLTDCLFDNITRRKIKGIQAFSPVPSVAVFTLQIIWYLGFSKVYFVGQDLSLGQDNQYYADGVKSFAEVEGKKPDLFVENNMGDKVGTLFQLFSHLESFNDLISLIDQDKIKLYNLSKYGAKIKGVPFIDKDTVQLSPRKNAKLPETFVESSFEGKKAINDTINEFLELRDEIRKYKKVIESIVGESINNKDITLLLKGFIKIRKHSILEEVITPQFSFLVQKINNYFTYKFDNGEVNREMVEVINKFVDHVNDFLIEILEDSRIKG